VKQVVQAISGGAVRVVDVPRPTIGATEVLVQTRASVISPGTEGAVTSLAQSSLLEKARARPDLVRQVIKKARNDGLAQTYQAVKSRLDSDLPLGYSAAGIAIEVGEAVPGIRPGMLVATAGAGKANHAEFQAVPGLLCAPVPDGVPAEEAAFATIASIALHGLRLADIQPGSKVAVIGLGLLGQLAVRLARAAGCGVVGIDVAAYPVARARDCGALGLEEAGQETTDTILRWTDGLGVDAVLVAAATPSSALMARVPELCRDRATVVVVGDVGLDLARTPFYEKELTVRFARSYGPGRYERSYEDWAVDYPPGYVRWTEGRNLQAFLQLLAEGQLAVADLVTQRFPLPEAVRAYELIESRSEPFLGIQLTYASEPTPAAPVRVTSNSSGASPGVGVIGTGAFASTVLMPAFRDAGFTRFISAASASGLSARRFAERWGFETCVSGAEAVIDDPNVDIVVIATPHEAHAALATQALRSGKDVFCEKPLAITMDDLAEVEEAWRSSGRTLFVGFNRRWSEAVKRARQHLEGAGPLVINYRVSAGPLPTDHWYHDRREGGRLVGEVSHFIDTCAALAGSPAHLVHALGAGPDERALSQDLLVALQHEDGSVAAITYGSGGHPTTAKESLQVLGGGRTATIADYAAVELDGTVYKISRDKGHRRQVAAFRTVLTEGDIAPTKAMLTSSATALHAAESLRTKRPTIPT
jgi:predicted dehydrogenase/threonine dehydrogenase-like Zn-dependent dehydrogenase